MTSMRRTLVLLSHTLTLRGALMFMLGISAIVWTEPFLVLALLGVGAVSAVFGLFEVGIAFAMRRRERRWLLVLAHGSASMTFGLLTVGSAGVPLRTALTLTATWLLVYAGVAGVGSHMAMPRSMARRAATAWGVFNVALAVLVVVYPAATIFSLLFFGAVYAAMFGAWQLAAGLWLRGSTCETALRSRDLATRAASARHS